MLVGPKTLCDKAADLDPQDQARLLHGNFCEGLLKSALLVRRPEALALVVVDDHDSISGPFDCSRVVGTVNKGGSSSAEVAVLRPKIVEMRD